MCYYDTYLIAPSSNSHTVPRELEHISEWAHANNLILNTAKSMEMIIHKPGLNLIIYLSLHHQGAFPESPVWKF